MPWLLSLPRSKPKPLNFMKPSLETVRALYQAAQSYGPLAIARVVESAARHGYTVEQLRAA